MNAYRNAFYRRRLGDGPGRWRQAAPAAAWRAAQDVSTLMSPAVAAIGLLIVLHRPDGIEIAVSPQHIVALQVTLGSAGRGANKLFTAKAGCILDLVGTRLAVAESCDAVLKLIGAANR